MTPAQITGFRDLIGKDKITLFADNVKLYNEKNEGEKLIWDDENQAFYCVRINSNNYTNNTKPISFQISGYDQIQYMSASLSIDELRTALTTLKAQGIELEVETICDEIGDAATYKIS